MIHSLAGGAIQKENFADYAKVKIIDGANVGKIFWYIIDFEAKEGDNVLVPFGIHNNLERAIILRIDKNVSSFASPVPYKRAKRVFKKL